MNMREVQVMCFANGVLGVAGQNKGPLLAFVAFRAEGMGFRV